MQCPHCGYVRDAFEDSCPRCVRQGVPSAAPQNPQGYPHGGQASVQQPYVPPTPIPPHQIYQRATFNGACPNCRHPVGVGVSICTHCRYEAGMAAPPQEKEPKRTGPYAIHPGIIFGVAGVALIGVAIAWGPTALAVAQAFLPSGGGGFGGGGGALPNLVLVQKGPGGGGGAGAVTAAPVSTDQIGQRLVTASASTGGDLEFSLAWNGLTDLDIQVKTPSGEIISAHEPTSTDGGEQDVDANPTPLSEEGMRLDQAGQVVGEQNVLPIKGMLADLDERMGGSNGIPGLSGDSSEKAGARYTRKPVEHVYFSTAPKGGYTVLVSCYSWQEANRQPLPYAVEIRSRGKVFHSVSGVIGPESYVSRREQPVQVTQIQLN